MRKNKICKQIPTLLPHLAILCSLYRNNNHNKGSPQRSHSSWLSKQERCFSNQISLLSNSKRAKLRSRLLRRTHRLNNKLFSQGPPRLRILNNRRRSKHNKPLFNKHNSNSNSFSRPSRQLFNNINSRPSSSRHQRSNNHNSSKFSSNHNSNRFNKHSSNLRSRQQAPCPLSSHRRKCHKCKFLSRLTQTRSCNSCSLRNSNTSYRCRLSSSSSRKYSPNNSRQLSKCKASHKLHLLAILHLCSSTSLKPRR
mmetsp:Transcript_25166/g.52342  ORF Transcript_25166/g.52342 Transcript_25166/m.52342 type:complete len:252 (-) Transcript_25166:1922-2677(-)